MNKLNFSFVYKKFKKRLQETYGKEIALLIWKKADAKLKNFSAEYKNIGSDEKIMILPLAAIYLSMKEENLENPEQTNKKTALEEFEAVKEKTEQAEIEIIVILLSARPRLNTIGIRIPKVPQEVPVAKEIPQATKKIIAGRKLLSAPADSREALTKASRSCKTLVPLPVPKLIASQHSLSSAQSIALTWPIARSTT